MESYSREFLQQYRKYHEADALVKTIIANILSHAASGHHGKFIQPLKGRLTHAKNEERTQIIQWMMNLLRNKFPDVDIEYREATDLRGNVDSEIVIDWGKPTVKSNTIRL
jgi:hypothetical protein